MKWRQWVQQPQNVWLRKAIFQVHLWSGIALGLYVFMISVTGSVLVYQNELYRAATPQPIISQSTEPRLTDEQLSDVAARSYPGYHVVNLVRSRNRDQAVDVWLRRGDELKQRLFDPRSGTDLGDSVSLKIWLVSKLLDLHDNLFAGRTGRRVNGVGAIAVIILAVSGLVIWWPGMKTWRRSLTVPRGIGWKRMNWHLHSMLGFWSLAFILIFGISGVYLGFPEPFQSVADRLDTLNRRQNHLLGGLSSLRPHQRDWHPVSWPRSLRSNDEGHLGSIRAGTCGDVCHRRNHVVEPGVAPATLTGLGLHHLAASVFGDMPLEILMRLLRPLARGFCSLAQETILAGGNNADFVRQFSNRLCINFRRLLHSANQFVLRVT